MQQIKNIQDQRGIAHSVQNLRASTVSTTSTMIDQSRALQKNSDFRTFEKTVMTQLVQSRQLEPNFNGLLMQMKLTDSLISTISLKRLIKVHI